MGEMKMGNNVHRAEIEPTSLAFLAYVQTISLLRPPDVTTLPTPTCLCLILPGRSLHIDIKAVKTWAESGAA